MKASILIITFFGLIFTSCKNNISEHKALYNPTENLAQVEREIDFWKNKIANSGECMAYNSKLAAAYSQEFSLTAKIDALKKAENLLKKNIADSPKNCNAYRALARNYISQHKFKEAKTQLLIAKDIGENLRYSNLLLFDVAQELAHDDEAKLLIEKLEEVKDFNYLIRAAKWQDGKGNLDRAIELLELAKERAENSKNQGQLTWIYSNLGDFYGHAGDLKKSKESFENALALNPADYYSYKGLAYMKWAAEKQGNEALSMIQKIEEHSTDPSVKLLEADILDYSGEKAQAADIRNLVSTQVSSPNYGAMYHSFLIQSSIDKNEIEKASMLAKMELQTRETPESYALLAMTKFHQNMKKEALDIALNEVVGKTFEPKVLLNILPVTREVDSLNQAILVEVEEASYEIGPLAYNKLEVY